MLEGLCAQGLASAPVCGSSVLVSAGLLPILGPALTTGLSSRSSRADGKPKAVLVIAPGSGTAAPGFWSSVALHDRSPQAGSCQGYVEQALGNGWEVVCLNPNSNFDHSSSKPIKGAFLTRVSCAGT